MLVNQLQVVLVESGVVVEALDLRKEAQVSKMLSNKSLLISERLMESLKAVLIQL